MDTLSTRALTSQLADDLGWLEQHARAQGDQDHAAGRLRLAAALVRNCLGPFLDNQPARPLHVVVVGGVELLVQQRGLGRKMPDIVCVILQVKILQVRPRFQDQLDGAGRKSLRRAFLGRVLFDQFNVCAFFEHDERVRKNCGVRRVI